jgi:flagellar biogenesis protein FliO
LWTLTNASGLLSQAWNWLRERQAARTNPKRLRVASSVSLGEKRFVAVIQVDGLEFLVGGGASNVALLAQLKGNDSFGNLLQETIAKPATPTAEKTGEQA